MDDMEQCNECGEYYEVEGDEPDAECLCPDCANGAN